jgi:5-methyltetrahydrofolate--homocysteine methyltransferase
MSGLLYHSDWIEARERLTTWWNGGDIGRPVIQLTTGNPNPVEAIPSFPEPEGWQTYYSTKSLPYRVHCALYGPSEALYFGEACPTGSPGDLAPNTLALYLGCKGREMPGTVWCEPCIESLETARFEYDPDNFYWKFSQDAFRQVAEKGKGKMLLQFPDLIEGLDTLAAMRGTQILLQDLIERPEWVHESLKKITQLYFHYYDMLYDIIRDDVGGSVYWVWAPGRLTKLQCDFSAMISPGMFKEFMVPVLTEMTERVSYSMYHWDGPDAVCHLDALLSIPHLDMIQWVPGDGASPSHNKEWWPLYHRILDSGKKLFIYINNSDHLLTFKKEFGSKMKGMLLNMPCSTPEKAKEILKSAEF